MAMQPIFRPFRRPADALLSEYHSAESRCKCGGTHKGTEFGPWARRRAAKALHPLRWAASESAAKAVARSEVVLNAGGRECPTSASTARARLFDVLLTAKTMDAIGGGLGCAFVVWVAYAIGAL